MAVKFNLCRYILMAEPDHVFINPIPNLARGGLPAAFPFFYIKPADHESIIRKYYPEEKGPVTNVDPIGNSPVIIKKVLTLEIPCLLVSNLPEIYCAPIIYCNACADIPFFCLNVNNITILAYVESEFVELVVPTLYILW